MDEFAPYNVYQCFVDGSYERIRTRVNAEEAVHSAMLGSTSVGAQIGTTTRVIITDNGDCISWEWRHGEGIVFPPEVAGRHP